MASRPPAWPKLCACGRTWCPVSWSDLPLTGEWHEGTFHVQLRTCACGSTISMPLALLGA